MRNRTGFTLIELLIVVAIIAILAAIAVPNFLEAQTRAKVSRSKADIRTQAVAMEAYFVDWNSYTRDSDSSLDMIDSDGVSMDMRRPDWGKYANGAQALTTPVAYMTSLLKDPFVRQVAVEGAGANGYRIGSGSWSYDDIKWNPADHQGSVQAMQMVGKKPSYVIIGVGPDGARARCAYKCFPFFSLYEGGASASAMRKGQPVQYSSYDPSNGTISIGDVYQFGGAYTDGRYMLDGQVVGAPASPGGNLW